MPAGYIKRLKFYIQDFPVFPKVDGSPPSTLGASVSAVCMPTTPPPPPGIPTFTGVYQQAEIPYDPGKYISLSYTDFITYAKVRSLLHPTKTSLYISTELDGGLFIPVIDCDSHEIACLAKRHITALKIPYIIFESDMKESSTHYWFFIDKVDFISGALEVMRQVFNDTRYYHCMTLARNVVVRGYPKNILPRIVEISQDESKFSALFISWIHDFQEYWKSEDVGEIFGNIFLRRV